VRGEFDVGREKSARGRRDSDAGAGDSVADGLIRLRAGLSVSSAGPIPVLAFRL